MKKKSYPKVCVALMVKNEEDRILNTLESIFGVAHEVYLYDTGSTDSTLKIIDTWSTEYNIPVYKKYIDGEWDRNFSKQRNILLEWIDQEFNGDFVLLLDANDEIQNKHSLKNWLKYQYNNPTETSSFLVHQRWNQGNNLDYWNVRVIKPRCNWRYFRRCHEALIKQGDSIGTDYEHGQLPEDIIWYQDRSFDQHKTQARIDNDISALLLDLEEYPDDSRTLYYLAQSYFAKDDYENAHKYYSLRVKKDGLFEEIFHSYVHLGNLSIKLNKPFNEISGWFLQAYKFWNRAEPLTYLANYCLQHNEYNMGLMFARESCNLGFPVNAKQPVDMNIYLFQRYLVKTLLCCRLDLLDEAQISIGLAYDNVPDNEQVKGIYEAIERKIKDRDEQVKKQSEEQAKNLKNMKIAAENMDKQSWMTQWKKAYQEANKHMNVPEQMLDRLAEIAYGKIFA